MIDDPNLGKPLDPSADAERLMGDSTGNTGITTDATNEDGNSPNNVQIDKTHLPGGVQPNDTKVTNSMPHPTNPDQNSTMTQSLPDEAALRAQDIATEPSQAESVEVTHEQTQNDIQQSQPGRTDLDGDPTIKNSMINTATPPHTTDEQSVSGTTPDPEQIQQNTTLDMAQNMGLYENASDENPQELNIAAEIDKDEAALRNG